MKMVHVGWVERSVTHLFFLEPTLLQVIMVGSASLHPPYMNHFHTKAGQKADTMPGLVVRAGWPGEGSGMVFAVPFLSEPGFSGFAD
jgi:hypothetical protein